MMPTDLIAFEDEIARRFKNKEIRAPVHLSGGNEKKLIDVFFQKVNPDDWVCTTWRSHYHCLLKGVPPKKLMAAILEGRSISLCFPEYRVISSAIVGGIAPIAVGIAMGIKRKDATNKVVCFLGDMAAETGIVCESMKYAINHRLPVLWVIEDNGLSVSTQTRKVWGAAALVSHPSIVRYQYTMTRKHVGLDEWVRF